MNKKILLIIGITCIVAGCVLSCLVDYQIADISGFAVTMFGAGLTSCTLWEKRNPKKNKLIAACSVIAIGAGAFMLGFGGFSESTMTTIITSVAGIVSVIVGIITISVVKKTE